MMSVQYEKICKDKHGFIDRIGRDSRRLQLLFRNDAEKSCEQIPQAGGGKPGVFPFPNFLKTFAIVRYSVKLQSSCPQRKYQLGGALLAR